MLLLSNEAFLKNEKLIFSSKNWSIIFLFESHKIENTKFSYKTALSKTNVKNRKYKMDLSPQRMEFC